jgi:hypothetical protein
MEAWEQGRNNVPDKILDILEKIFKSEGINITKNWILSGNIYEPINNSIKNPNISKIHSLYSVTKDINYLKGDLNYFSELKFFQETNKDSIVTMILDDALAPYFNKGDYVGGVAAISETMEKYIGKFCILKMPNSDIVTRKVVNFKNNQKATICSINPKATLHTPDYYTISFDKIALITRHWLCSLLINDKS